MYTIDGPQQQQRRGDDGSPLRREDTHLHSTAFEYPSNCQMLRCQWGPNDENHCGIMTLNSLNQNVKLRSFLPASVSFTAYLSSSSGNVNRKRGMK